MLKYQLSSTKQYLRDGFSAGLLESAALNKNVVGLCADLNSSIKMDGFAEKYPERFFQVGVAEQNLAGVAAGFALMGKIPVMGGYAAFSPGRNWDQIRVSIAYSKLNVKIIGSHAGISVGPDGATHQALEDIGLMRILPNMIVIAPADYEETRKAIISAINYQGPVYIRIPREKFETVTTLSTAFEIGKANKYCDGEMVTIIASGPLLYQAIEASIFLKASGITCEVLGLHTIKPLDEETVLKSVKKTKAVVTIEDGQIAGGVGGAISELLSEKCPVPVLRMGISDSFGESGTSQELLDKYDLNTNGIIRAVKKVLKMKLE